MYVIYINIYVWYGITVGCDPTLLNIDYTLTPSAFNRMKPGGERVHTISKSFTSARPFPQLKSTILAYSLTPL